LVSLEASDEYFFLQFGLKFSCLGWVSRV